MPDWPERDVCALAALADPGTRAFEIGDGDWPFRGLLLRLDGELYAYANICPHRLHPLDSPPGQFLVPREQLLRCASHGALFVAETGQCILGPCAGQGLLRLDCRQAGGRVLVRAPATLQAGIELLRTGGSATTAQA